MDSSLVGTLRRAIATVREIPVEQVHADSRLEDLGVDSLAITEIIVQIELELDREFPVHLLRELERLDTVEALATEMAVALAECDLDERR